MSHSTNLYPWLNTEWQRLHGYIQQDRIPQALLISGQAGIGKLQLAEQFASALMCSQPNSSGFSCGQCQHCALIKAQTHPDFINIEPEEAGKRIVIDQIRQLVNKLTLKPQYEGNRVVIIHPADEINHFAANAFLKCLEEPNERTINILVTDNPSKLPITITSRCQKITIPIPEKQIALQWLNQQGGNDAEILLALAQGAPLKAYNYQQQKTLQIRNECFTAWIEIAKHQAQPTLVAEQWCKYALPDLILWMTTWVIDLTKLKFNINEAKLFNPDLKNTLQGLEKKLDKKSLYKLYYLLINNPHKMHGQLNQQMQLEEILIQWSQIGRRY